MTTNCDSHWTQCPEGRERFFTELVPIVNRMSRARAAQRCLQPVDGEESAGDTMLWLLQEVSRTPPVPPFDAATPEEAARLVAEGTALRTAVDTSTRRQSRQRSKRAVALEDAPEPTTPEDTEVRLVEFMEYLFKEVLPQVTGTRNPIGFAVKESMRRLDASRLTTEHIQELAAMEKMTPEQLLEQDVKYRGNKKLSGKDRTAWGRIIAALRDLAIHGGIVVAVLIASLIGTWRVQQVATNRIHQRARQHQGSRLSDHQTLLAESHQRARHHQGSRQVARLDQYQHQSGTA